MDQRTTLIETLNKARSSMIAHLDEIDRNRKIYPLWTIREILAHISGWDDAIIEVMRSLQEGKLPATPAVRGADAYNAETVATREGLDYDHIYREFIETRKTLLDMLGKLPEEKVGQPSRLPWGAPGNLVELITLFSGHETNHAVDIKRIVEEAQKAASQ